MSSDLIIVGSSGFAQEVLWLAQECGRNVVGFLDDAPGKQATFLMGLPILGAVADWGRYQNAEFVVAIGAPRVRKAVVSAMTALGSPQFALLIHPSVKMSRWVEVEPGSIITAGSVITTNIRLGRHTIVNLNSTIGHETTLEDFCTLAPLAAVSGGVYLEEGVEVGTGACIRQGIRMARGSVLGMGGVLTKDVPENAVFAGNPAKPLKMLDRSI